MRQPFWRDPFMIVVLCSLIILISYGTRQIFGLFLIPISNDLADGRVEPFSFAVALQTLVVGISVPFVAMASDRWLGPIGQRLRLARRDQEVCRLILLSLVRMAHPQRLRRRTKQAIVRRSCYPEALRLLESLSAILGGEFVAALEYWRRSSRPDTRERTSRDSSDSVDGPPRRRRRGSRGGSRRSSQDSTDDKPETEKPAPRPKEVPLDFFAALPSAPTDEQVTDDDSGRYGGDQFGEQEVPQTEDRPRRRRRRRRRKAAQDATSESSPESSSEPSDDDGAES